MLPDHALHASSDIADRHARAGSNRMEVARCERRGALLRSTRAGCRADQRPVIQFIRTHVKRQHEQQFKLVGCCSQLHQCRDLEAQQGNDRCQHGRSGQCGRARRTGVGERPSSRAVYGRQAGIRLSRTRYGVRDVGCRARCALIGTVGDRCAGQERHTKRAGRVLCATGIRAESSSITARAGQYLSSHAAAIAVVYSRLNFRCMQSVRQHLQSEQSWSVPLQGSILSW
jgi:hypothetical protein